MEVCIGVLLVVALFTNLLDFSHGSCVSGAADGGPLCCLGKDNDCNTDGYQISARSYGKCYCDTTCVHTRDCCMDYEETCPGKPIKERGSRGRGEEGPGWGRFVARNHELWAPTI